MPFLPWTDRGKGKHAAGAHSEHAADDALLAHANANDGMVVALAPQKLDHGNIVGERSGGTDDFVEVCGEGAHLFQSFVQLLGPAKVVKRKNQPGAAPKLLQLLRLALKSGLEFDVYQLAARAGRFAENIQLGRDRTAKLASARRPPAGSNHRNTRMGLQEVLNLGKGQAGF